MKRVTFQRVFYSLVYWSALCCLRTAAQQAAIRCPATDNPVPTTTPATVPNPAQPSSAVPGPAASGAAQRQDVDVSAFYDELSPYGRWINDDQYGDVWMPSGVEAGWRPYTHGNWSDTNEGWAWVSDEQFGWPLTTMVDGITATIMVWEWVPGSTGTGLGCLA